jgi:hypothetical protein
MINQSIDASSFAPTDYSDFASSIVGKPLALANIGFSLELARKPLVPQISILPPKVIAKDADPEHWIADGEHLNEYQFPIKIGDVSRAFDGVVGYFDMKETPMTPIAPLDGNNVSVISNPNCVVTGDTFLPGIIHTYFTDQDASKGNTTDKRRPIGSDQEGPEYAYPTVTPYWIDPDSSKIDPQTTDTKPADFNMDATFQIEHYKRYHVKAVIMDPFTPIHLYSPILPITTLKLPSWTVQDACRKMTAFFHLGPMLVTRDVPTYATLKRFNLLATADTQGGAGGQVPVPTLGKTDTGFDKDGNKLPLPDPPSIAIPMSVKDKWRWLQPYDKNQTGEQEPTTFGSLPLVEDDGKPKLPPGPYVATEGYLQLLEGIVKPVGVA